jgi:hypothetical protein
MAWQVPKLIHRVKIGEVSQTANDDGGFDLAFTSLLTVWMGFKPLKFKNSGLQYIRDEQINETVTHEFLVRKLSVASLSSDLMPLKSEYFLLLKKHGDTQGRLFQIRNVTIVDETDEFLRIGAEENEERTVGFTA